MISSVPNIWFTFCRVGSHKIFAVSEGDLIASKGKQKRPVQYVISDRDSSEEDFQPPWKKVTPATSAEVRQVAKEVKQVQQQIESFFQITTSMTVHLVSTNYCMLDSFKCHICHVSPIEPPVIIARCCRWILGYQVCAGTWYHQDDNMARTFPMCRAERAYSDTKTLRGLDDLLSNLSNHGTLMGTSHHRDVCSSSPWPLTVQLHMCIHSRLCVSWFCLIYLHAPRWTV